MKLVETQTKDTGHIGHHNAENLKMSSGVDLGAKS
jgi:hypothetical protein